MSFVDAYAGTGAVGIEALSRGAARAIFLERSRAAVEVIRENLRTLPADRHAEVLQGRVLQYLPHRHGDIVFLDPPYDLEAARTPQGALEVLGEGTPPPLVVVQHSVRLELDGRTVVSNGAAT